MRRLGRPSAAALSLLVAAAACGGAASGEAPAREPDPPIAAPAPFYSNAFEKVPSPKAMTALGRALFFDPALSASGKTACATCHDPKHAFGAPNDLAVQRGGRNLAQAGVRAVPPLMYTQNVPPFTEHFFDTEDDDSIDQGPAGGRTWDGRSQSLHDQAQLPLLSPFEMANENPEAVVVKVEHAAHAAEFRATFGEHVFTDRGLAFKGILMALETYQQSPAEFYPYSSKYDAYLRGAAALSAQELRGMSAFNDPERGNCARCHPSAIRAGAFPQFTDFGYAAIGVPRNPAIPANADPGYYDLGLCGPLRKDLADKKEYCGLFRTPSLRNAALRGVFFHNGVVRRLDQAVRFYAERDTLPAKWYPRGTDGRVSKFNDLPAAYRAQVDREPPFDRQRGGRPALTEADVADITVFLATLTDGYRETTASTRVGSTGSAR